MDTQGTHTVLLVVSICLAVGAGVAALIALRSAVRAHRALEALSSDLRASDLQLKEVREGQQHQGYFINALRSTKGIGESELDARANFFSDCSRFSWQPNQASLFSVAADIKTEEDRRAKTDFLQRCRSLLPEAQGDALLAATVAVRTQAEVDAAIAVLRKQVVEEVKHVETQVVRRQRGGGRSSDAARDYDEWEEEVEIIDQPRNVSVALALLGNPRELRDKIIASTEVQQGRAT